MPAITTMTSNDVCARVRARWSALLPLPLIARADHNIALTIFGGLERLARAIKDSADRALLVTELINKAPAAGRIDLTHADYAGMLIDTFKLPGAIVTTAESATVFTHVISMDQLRAKTPTDASRVWYHLRGKTLVFKNPVDSALNTYAVPVNLAGSYIPELGNANRPLPGELDDQLVDRVAEIVKELGGMAFLKMDPDQASEAMKSLANG